MKQRAEDDVDAEGHPTEKKNSKRRAGMGMGRVSRCERMHFLGCVRGKRIPFLLKSILLKCGVENVVTESNNGDT